MYDWDTLFNDLPIGVFHDHLAVSKFVKIAAANLNPLTGRGRAREQPFRDTDVAINVVTIFTIVDIGYAFEPCIQSGPNIGKPFSS